MEVEVMLKMMEALRLQKEELNERAVLKMEREMLMREKEELRIKNEVLKKEKEELEEGKIELKKQMEAFLLEKLQFWKEKGLEKEKEEFEEDKELECRDQENREMDVQHSDALDTDICEKLAPSIAVYKTRTKRVLKPSVYKRSPFTSIYVIQTTPSKAADTEKPKELCTSPIPFQAKINPLRKISEAELHELDSWANANKEAAEFGWFRTIWEKNAWVDSVAIDKYVDFLERRHGSFPTIYTKDCKFCPIFFLVTV
ncbi:uncharacterized protein LOC131230538 [Magnolia sinica]|uniref:uncharacterized protein LOC131230538 n=1 Tax=Magnolia sinica TaxID=86752 RepID=UPI00265A08F2|nr:uncharacterized protein LOC131230538 [Magnolia sinica]